MKISQDKVIKIGNRYFDVEQLIHDIIESRQIREYQEEEIDFGEQDE